MKEVTCLVIENSRYQTMTTWTFFWQPQVISVQCDWLDHNPLKFGSIALPLWFSNFCLTFFFFSWWDYLSAKLVSVLPKMLASVHFLSWTLFQAHKSTLCQLLRDIHQSRMAESIVYTHDQKSTGIYLPKPGPSLQWWLVIFDKFSREGQQGK